MAREARRAGLSMAARPVLTSEHQAILIDLAATPTGAFDASYAENGDEDRLRRFASDALPSLEDHRAMVTDLQGSATGSVAAVETPATRPSTSGSTATSAAQVPGPP